MIRTLKRGALRPLGRRRWQLVAWLLLLRFATLLAAELDDRAALSACIALFIRNGDEPFLQRNLGAWARFIDCYVVAVDDRIVDASLARVEEALGDKPGHAFMISFRNWGATWTDLLEASWEHFPNVTYTILADPSWQPHFILLDDLAEAPRDRGPLGLGVVIGNKLEATYPSIWANRAGNVIHERCPITFEAPYTGFPSLDWGIQAERELPGCLDDHDASTFWAGPAQSTSAGLEYSRWAYLVQNLELDMQGFADSGMASARLLFHLGRSHLRAKGAGEEARIPDSLVAQHSKSGMKYLQVCIDAAPQPLSLSDTKVWTAALFWLGYAHHRVLERPRLDVALELYERCAHAMSAISPTGSLDCILHLSLAHLELGNFEAAIFSALGAAALPPAEHGFWNSAEAYNCAVPLQASRSLAAAVLSGTSEAGHLSLDEMKDSGRVFLEEARRYCSGVGGMGPGRLFDAPADILMRLEKVLA
jgi:hypothetical protein